MSEREFDIYIEDPNPEDGLTNLLDFCEDHGLKCDGYREQLQELWDRMCTMKQELVKMIADHPDVEKIEGDQGDACFYVWFR